MAKSLSTRFGLQRWSADSDTQQRSEFDNDAAQLELYAAKTGHGTIGARPAASAAWADAFWLITDATGGGVLGTLYYCDGTTWTIFAPRSQGLATNRPAAALATRQYYKTDSDLLSVDDGTAWHDFPSKAVTDAAYQAIGTSPAKTYRLAHTFTISGLIAVPSGATAYIPPFFISLPTGQTATIAAARHRVRGGTSATWTVSHGTVDAGTSVTGLTGIASTTTVTTTTASGANTVADGDAIQLVVTAISGTPDNLSVTVFLDVTK